MISTVQTKLFIFLYIILCVFNNFTFVHGTQRVIYEKVSNKTVEHTWLEVGFAFLDDTNWLNITTKNDQFATNVVAFISLPDIGGSLYNESIPLVPKLQYQPIKNNDNTWTFHAKLVQARGSFCSTEWYTPVPIEPVQISWMIVEKNMFELSLFNDDNSFNGYQTLLIDSSNITRNNSDSDLSDGSTDGHGNFARVWYVPIT